VTDLPAVWADLTEALARAVLDARRDGLPWPEIRKAVNAVGDQVDAIAALMAEP
jgi:hypothetical protein